MFKLLFFFILIFKFAVVSSMETVAKQALLYDLSTNTIILERNTLYPCILKIETNDSYLDGKVSIGADTRLLCLFCWIFAMSFH